MSVLWGAVAEAIDNLGLYWLVLNEAPPKAGSR
jgi:hypothetical protein